MTGGDEYSNQLAKEMDTLKVSKFISLKVNGKEIDLDNTDFGEDFYNDIVDRMTDGETPAGESSSAVNLPEYDGKTTYGVLVLEDGEQIPFSSGNANSNFKNYISASYVEGKSAIYMRENNINKGTVFHNNTDGTCPYCDKMLPTLLEEGSSLTVVPPNNASAPKPSWVDNVKTYTRNARVPKEPK